MVDTDQKKRLVSAAFNSSELELIILPTEQCNFRCTYCYEDFELGKMKPEVIQGIKKLIEMRSTGLDLLKLNWFGGEPLLAKKIILDVMKFSKDLSSVTLFKIFSEMTTNGYLLDVNTARELIELGVSNYQISIDGDEAFHNKTRIKANGGGTFNKVWSNLISLKKSELDFTITIRLHLTPMNIQSIPSILRKIKNDLLVDSRFILFVKEIGNYGGKNSKSIDTLSNSDAMFVKSIIQGTMSTSKKKQDLYVCYAGKANSYVIRANGRINKCTVALNDNKNEVGQLNENGTLSLKQDKIKKWMVGFDDFNSSVLGCPAGSVLKKENNEIEVLTL